MRVRRPTIAAAALLSSASAVMAQDADKVLPGQPHDWQITLQEALSPIEEQIHWFSNYTLAFIIPITILVAALIGWCAYRYNEKRNPTPSRTSHNTTIEVVWTLAPVIILLFLAIPSFQLLTAQYNPPSEPELTIKATGYQWYWGYEYQPSANSPQAKAEPVSFDSLPLAQLTDSPRTGRRCCGKDDIKQLSAAARRRQRAGRAGRHRRFASWSTSADVIHSFAHALFRRQGRRRARPPQRDLVQRRPRGHLLRPVLRAVRQGPCLHADRRARRLARSSSRPGTRRPPATSAAPTRR